MLNRSVFSLILRIPGLFLTLLLFIRPCYCQDIGFNGPNQAELVEGKSYTLSWTSSGGETVKVIIHGTRTPLGAVSRGEFVIPVAQSVPSIQGQMDFILPWIDSRNFAIKIKEYDVDGKVVSTGEREYGFRPAVMENRTMDGIYLDLHRRINQRLYVQKAGRITQDYLCSSSENYLWLPPKQHPSIPHDHAGVFKVLERNPDHYSALFHVHMYWAMRYLAGHFIHATSPNLYRRLGRPASHGCNRMTRHDAEELSGATPVGTRVEVIGPKGYGSAEVPSPPTLSRCDGRGG